MGKKLNCVSVFFDDRDFVDLGEAADTEDRSPADLLRHLFRQYMRKKVHERLRERQHEQGALGASAAPSSVTNVSTFTARARGASEPIPFADPWKDTQR
jgi:hypothetical protein